MSEYLKLIAEARSKGLVISKEYLRRTQERFRHLNKQSPNLWKAVMSKRYLLPNYLSGEYINQGACDYLFLDFLLSYTGGYVPQRDDVVDTCYLSAVRAIEYQRPTYYLERALGERLLATEVPVDVAADDIHWIYPQFRVYLPLGLLSINRNGAANPAMFIDVCKINAGDHYNLTPMIKNELRNMQACFHFPDFTMPVSGFATTANLHFDCPESNISYAVTAPWEGKMIRQIIESTQHDLQGALVNDETDKIFLK